LHARPGAGGCASYAIGAGASCPTPFGRLDLEASWRPIHHQKTSAIKIGGSPFKTLAEAEEACEAMLSRLVRLALPHPSRRPWGLGPSSPKGRG